MKNEEIKMKKGRLAMNRAVKQAGRVIILCSFFSVLSSFVVSCPNQFWPNLDEDGGNQTPMQDITAADIAVTVPLKGEIPDTTVPASAAGFTCGAVSWSPGHNPFQGNVKYTAHVTLTAKEGFTFSENFTATINGQPAAVINNGSSAVLSYEFAATLPAELDGIAVKTQPMLNYTHGEALDLSAFVVTLIYDGAEPEDVPASGFAAKGLSANPADGTPLAYVTHNGQPVAVSLGSYSADTAALTVSKKTLTITGVTAASRAYNGGTAVNISGGSLQGVVTGDAVGFSLGSGTITDANAGNGKPVAVAITLTGADAGNYTLTQPAVAVDITPKAIEIAAADALVKTHDGDATALAGAVSFSGLADGESLVANTDYTVSAMFTGGDYTAGSPKPYTYTVTMLGTTKANNYILAANTYDGNDGIINPSTGAAVSSIAIKTQPARLAYAHGDSLDLSALVVTLAYDDLTTADVPLGSFAAKNISANPADGSPLYRQTHNGLGVTVTCSGYSADTAALTVSKKTLTITGVSAADRAYDGGLDVALSGGTLQGVAAGDSVGFTLGSGTVQSAGVGINKPVTTAIQLTGTDADHYTLTQPAVAVNINPKAISINTVAALTKTYDGTANAAAGAVSFSGLVGGESLVWGTDYTVSAVFTGGDYTAGTRPYLYTVTMLDTANANNYNLSPNTKAGTDGTISAAGKTTPTVTTWPSSGSVTYGAALSASTLTGGAASVTGSFAWTNGAAIPTVTNTGYEVTFTPDDTANFNTVTGTVAITVAKATPAYTAPTGLTATYGDTLADVSLPSGFTWDAATTTSVGNAGTNNFNVTFTPSDTANYITVTGISVAITVSGTRLININFAQITGDPLTWTGGTEPIIISRNGNGGYAATLELVLEDSDQYDDYLANGIKWLLSPQTGVLALDVQTGDTFTFTSPDSLDYTGTDTYTLTLQVKKGGVPYNRTIQFKVVE